MPAFFNAFRTRLLVTGLLVGFASFELRTILEADCVAVGTIPDTLVVDRLLEERLPGGMTGGR